MRSAAAEALVGEATAALAHAERESFAARRRCEEFATTVRLATESESRLREELGSARASAVEAQDDADAARESERSARLRANHAEAARQRAVEAGSSGGGLTGPRIAVLRDAIEGVLADRLPKPASGDGASEVVLAALVRGGVAREPAVAFVREVQDLTRRHAVLLEIVGELQEKVTS